MLLGGCAGVSTGSYSADRIALTAAGGAMKTHLTGGDPKIAAAIAVIDGLVLLAKEVRKSQPAPEAEPEAERGAEADPEPAEAPTGEPAGEPTGEDGDTDRAAP